MFCPFMACDDNRHSCWGTSRPRDGKPPRLSGHRGSVWRWGIENPANRVHLTSFNKENPWISQWMWRYLIFRQSQFRWILYAVVIYLMNFFAVFVDSLWASVYVLVTMTLWLGHSQAGKFLNIVWHLMLVQMYTNTCFTHLIISLLMTSWL